MWKEMGHKEACVTDKDDDGNEGALLGAGLCHKNNILVISRVQMWL